MGKTSPPAGMGSKQRFAVTAAALLAVVVGLSLTRVARTLPGPEAPGPFALHDRVSRYWTPERRQAARVASVPARPAASTSGRALGPAGVDPGGPRPVTLATGPGGPGGLAAGRVFFRTGRTRYTCSATAVSSRLGSVVLTAGHCVKAARGRLFASDWIFFPGYDGGPHPELGGWTASDLFTTAGWADEGRLDDDVGWAVVYDHSGRTLEDAIRAAGGGPVPSVAFRAASAYRALGLPSQAPGAPAALHHCAGPAVAGLDGRRTLAMRCDLAAGASGGPWLEAGSEPAPVVSSVTSHGFAGLPGHLFGPRFDDPERAAHEAAVAGDCPPQPVAFRCADQTDAFARR